MRNSSIQRRVTASVTMAAAATVALGQAGYVATTPVRGGFAIAVPDKVAPLVVDANDYPGVIRVVGDLAADIQRVSGQLPSVSHEVSKSTQPIIVGTLGRSRIVDDLVARHKLDAAAITGKWESFVIQVVKNPLPGVSSALVIAGSDKRGSIFGAYDVSERIGVSPWYWWADVPPKRHSQLFVRGGRYVQNEPAVKYRGIFLNDEAPNLSNWVHEKFGDYNSKFYVHVFELLLRLKANYLWPAMWNNCFNEDDSLNPKLADEYGIVMGTSHVEPMMRADKEWDRAGFNASQWRFDKFSKELSDFWTAGIERNKGFENIVTIAMRGKIDTPMSETANIALLEKIVAAQRKLIAEHVNPDVTKVPQLWALYKEVQEYYEKGMRVPDDVTLLWCDDNWGDIRRLPTAEERNRSGGAGVYYHYDYVGGPRNYKWTNTNPLPKVWEQMNGAYEAGANRIWIVNVGCLKPKEFPIEFFLKFAWDPKAWPKDSLHKFTLQWATREFGPEHAADIADIVEKYGKYNGRRKPELLDADTYSVVNYGEADRVVADFQEITDRAEKIYAELSADQRDAFYQLVLFPTKSSKVVNELYVAVAKNRLYAKQGRASANAYAEKARALFKEDADLAEHFNKVFAGGRWSHFQDQTHIGYTYWQQPDVNAMPKVSEVVLASEPSVGVAVEGSELSWPAAPTLPSLPEFTPEGPKTRWIDVYAKGMVLMAHNAHPSAPWIVVTPVNTPGVSLDHRLLVSIDWSRLPGDEVQGSVEIESAAGTVSVPVHASRPVASGAFMESDGYVSIEAEHYEKNVAANGLKWETIPGYGRTLSGLTVGPLTSPSAVPGSGPCLSYAVSLRHAGTVTWNGIFGPSLSTYPGRGLRCAVAFDDQKPTVIDIDPHYLSRDWETAVSDSVRTVKTKLVVDKPGLHTLKIWMIDPGVVLEKLVLDTGGLRPSYLGPPESGRG